MFVPTIQPLIWVQTLDHINEKGSLIDAINILREHLPKGTVPNKLPLGTLKKIKADTILDAPRAEVHFWLPE